MGGAEHRADNRGALARRSLSNTLLAVLCIALGAATLAVAPGVSGAASTCHESPIPVANQAAPDLAYDFWVVGPSTRRLNVYLPTGPAPTPAGHPMVVFVHGGSWTGGTEAMAASEGLLAQRANGFAVVSIDFRNTCEINPATGVEYPWPVPIYDIWTSVAWLREVLAPGRTDLNLDASSIVLYGVGSGGHLATTAANLVDLTSLSQRSSVSGVVSLFSPYNLADPTIDATNPDGSLAWPELANGANDLLSCGLALTDCTPVRRFVSSPGPYASAADAPILIVHGRNDQLIPSSNAEDFWVTMSTARGASAGDEAVDVRSNGTDQIVYSRSTHHLDLATLTCVLNDGGALLDADHGCVQGPQAWVTANAISDFLQTVVGA